MIEIKTNSTLRNISYLEYDISKNWTEALPSKNWCLIIIADENKPSYFSEIIEKSIDRNVGYICAIGSQHDLIHDMADEIIVFREVEVDDYHVPNHCIITVGDEDFEEGIWFGLYCTHNNDYEIKNIVIIDFTESYSKLIELIKKFEIGYLPEEKTKVQRWKFWKK